MLLVLAYGEVLSEAPEFVFDSHFIIKFFCYRKKKKKVILQSCEVFALQCSFDTMIGLCSLSKKQSIFAVIKEMYGV